MTDAGFQGFDATTRPEQGPPRLAALRAALAESGLDGFLVPRADAHQGEYVTPRDEVLAWLTGFTGSAGFCAVTRETAGLFVDGRYRVQVKSQVDTSVFTPVDWPETSLSDWLKAAMAEGGTLGFDPWRHTRHEIDQLRQKLADTGITIRPYEAPLIDRIWPDRPAPPDAPVTAYPPELAGEMQVAKRARIGKALAEANEDFAILTLPDSICWLLNLRGADIPRIPIAQGFAILSADGGVRFYRRDGSAAEEIRALTGAGVRVLPESDFADDVRALEGRVRCDPKTAPYSVAEALEQSHAEPVWAADPCLLPKARKNATEIAATREAHLRDAGAMVEFLAWLDAAAPRDGLTEIDIVSKLEGFRRATNALRDISFDTICGSGPNGAIVHYRVTRETDRTIAPGDLLLVDSGGQYLDGTTDITRTVTTGTPDADQRAAFTRVLKGMIAISRVRWPNKLTGRDLDPLARAPLWMAGQDYDHGTGHGVGVFLSVHEGPQRISRLSDVPLEPGMILSNEPGYYREGHWGIRIENLVVVIKAPKLAGGDDREQLAFETLTWVPIDTRLVIAEELSPGERGWLNDYHARVLEHVGPRVSGEALDWLRTATRAI